MKELVQYQGHALDIHSVMSMAEVFVQSGYFRGLKDIAQAAVKIMAGAELGIPPVASMRGIEMVENQISMRAHLMAAMVKKTGKYTYRVHEMSNTRCEIEYFENGESIGMSEFTMDDAKAAGLAHKDNWKKYAKSMLYNRAMSIGAKTFCPDVFFGAIYDEGEIETPVWAAENSRQTTESLTASPRREDDTTDAVVIEPATDKQVKFLTSLMAQHGVPSGNAHAILDEIYPDGLEKHVVSAYIEIIKEEKRLPDKIFGHLMKRLREEHDVSKDALVENMQEMLGVDKPTALEGEAQIQLIEWVKDQAQDDIPEKAPKQSWDAMIGAVAGELEIDEKEISEHILNIYEWKYEEVHDLPVTAMKRFGAWDMDKWREELVSG